jgi:hypothetical protein
MTYEFRVETELNRWLRERRTQHMFIRATASAAPCQFTVNYDCGHASDTVMHSFGCDFGLVHVMDHHLMRRTGYPLDEVDCFLAH